MKRNQQAKKISYIMILTLLLSVCSAVSAPTGAAAEVKPAAGKNYSETWNRNTIAWRLFLNVKGKIRFINDYWRQETYGISDGKEVKKSKDSIAKAVKKVTDDFKDDNDLIRAVSTNKKGTIGYISTWEKIFRYNKKGKITKVFNPSKKLGVKKVFVGEVRCVKSDLVAAELLSPNKKVPNICLINMKKGKIVKKYKRKYATLYAADGKNLYVGSGSVEKKTEKIVKIKASSGKKLAAISTAPIYKLAAGRMESKNVEDTPPEYLRDDPVRLCYANGKLYLQHLSGIYTWDGKGKDFKTVLDGRNNENYTWFKGWNNYMCPYCLDFQVDKDETMYILTCDWNAQEVESLYIYRAS